MAKRNIGATLSIKDGNFTTSIRSAVTSLKNFKTQTTNATGSLKKMSTQSKSAGDTLAGLAHKVTGVVAAYAGFSQAKAFMTDCVTGVFELERANERLGTLMMNVQGTTKAQVDEIIKYGDALELVTTIEGDATVAGASQLATFQLQSSTIKSLLPSLQNLAVGTYGVNVTQEQMIQTGNLVGKVMQGQIGALSRVGVSFTAAQGQILKTGTEAEKTATLIEVLDQNFGGLAENMANTPEGKIIQLKNAWGSVKDIVGYGVLPVVTGVVTFMASKIPQAQQFMTNAVNAVTASLLWIKDAVIENADSFSGILTILDGLKGALFSAFEFCKPAISWLADVGLSLIIDALAGVVAGATSVYNFFSNNWNLIAPVIAGIAGAILVYKGAVLAVNVVQGAWATIQGVCTAAQWALNVALTANPIGIIIVAIGALIAIGVAMWMNWDSICAWCKNAFKAVGDYFTKVGKSIGTFFTGLWTGIKNTAVSIWDGITSYLKNAWNSISSGASAIFSAMGNTIKNVWTGIVGAVKGAINSVISAINSMIRGAVNGINGLIKGINKVANAVGVSSIPTFTAPQIPLLAKGGVIQSLGTVIVGEKGPEMLTLPKGAQVTPLANKPLQKAVNHFNINIYADGKSVEEIIDELIPKLKLALANL